MQCSGPISKLIWGLKKILAHPEIEKLRESNVIIQLQRVFFKNIATCAQVKGMFKVKGIFNLWWELISYTFGRNKVSPLIPLLATWCHRLFCWKLTFSNLCQPLHPCSFQSVTFVMISIRMNIRIYLYQENDTNEYLNIFV